MKIWFMIFLKNIEILSFIFAADPRLPIFEAEALQTHKHWYLPAHIWKYFINIVG